MSSGGSLVERFVAHLAAVDKRNSFDQATKSVVVYVQGSDTHGRFEMSEELLTARLPAYEQGAHALWPEDDVEVGTFRLLSIVLEEELSALDSDLNPFLVRALP